MKKFIDPKKYYFTDVSFKLLMRKRINHVLLLSSTYDAFILEEDGRIDEQLFNEYVSLNLRYPPQFIIATSDDEARSILSNHNIDLIINMLSAQGKDSFLLTEQIKKENPDIPIVILTPFSKDVRFQIDKLISSGTVDYVFNWLGNGQILLAIIKLIEDKMNVEFDVSEVGLQTIILVEDSVKFYSSYLPLMYNLIFNQSKQFMMEGLNEHQQMLRLRGRPKILLATCYEEAVSLYEKYKNNLLGIISDIRFKKGDRIDPQAGIKLCEKIRQDDIFLPFILQSSSPENEALAKKYKVGFINKNSKDLLGELKNYINEHFLFGDFIFRNPRTLKEIDRAHDLQSLQNKLFQAPDDSFEFHIRRNDFSKWLKARSLFQLAEMIKDLTLEDFSNINHIRKYLFDSIASFRLHKIRGIIAEFNRETFDEYFLISRIGSGSIGGKARGLAFIDSLIKRHRIYNKYENVIVSIPRSVVLTTDIFDEFMEFNKLYKIALSDLPDEEILGHFINARLPQRIHQDILTFTSVIRNPIAVRSSSLLEDSMHQPFAGIYSTYMLPFDNNEKKLIEQLCYAIKCVYASVFFKASKSYMKATSNLINEEKMAIILQEVCGHYYDDHYYPTFSGVARSVNFYPTGPEKIQDGIANIALGLGRYVVNGELSLRFSPAHPRHILQLSDTNMALRQTQKYFYALDLNLDHFKPSLNDGINVLRLPLTSARRSVLKYVASTYDFENQMLRDGIQDEGKKVITFSTILHNHFFPFTDILKDILEKGQKEMNNPVEIEFAVNMDVQKGFPAEFYLLQIRPIVENKETTEINLDNIPKEKLLVYSKSTLGNGILNNIKDIVLVKPESFNSLKSLEIETEIEKINETLVKESRFYILIGPGRWGSSDPNLGIPVKWQQISGVKIIIETDLGNYRVEPSQGTHFFQNLTALNVGYFTINSFGNEGFYDIDYLTSLPSQFEGKYIRHIRLEKELTVIINGRDGIGVIVADK